MIARFHRPFSIRRLHREEAVSLEADDNERKAIAEALDLIALDSLTADVRVRPWKEDGVRVEGVVRGRLTQPCGVTLEPVPGEVEEDFDIRLHPDASAFRETVDVDVEAPDPPELLDSDIVDIGAIALEHFVLGIDPYPRAPGAVFDEAADAKEETPSPFAVLAALKNAPH